MRFILFFLAACGIVVSGLALHVHYSTDIQPCSINEKWDCGIVNHSRFAEIAHVPVAAIGIAGMPCSASSLSSVGAGLCSQPA